MPVQEFQLKEIERRVAALERRTEDVNVLRVQIDQLKSDVHDLSDKVSSINRALYTAALSVAGGAIIFAVSILQVVGH